MKKAASLLKKGASLLRAPSPIEEGKSDLSEKGGSVKTNVDVHQNYRAEGRTQGMITGREIDRNDRFWSCQKNGIRELLEQKTKNSAWL